MTYKISSKADVLKSLYGRLKFSKIEKMKIVTGGEILDDPYKIADEIYRAFAGQMIVVRSSSSNEDGMNTSNAGHYESILGVDSQNTESVVDALRNVLGSYTCDIKDVSDEQVLVQKQVDDISYSGVIFSGN